MGKPGCLLVTFLLTRPCPFEIVSRCFPPRFAKDNLYDQVPHKVWRKEWVVHCKPVGDGQAALKYLAPYIHRVAISNRRLVIHRQRGGMETSPGDLPISRFRYWPTQDVHALGGKLHAAFSSACASARICEGALLRFLWRLGSSPVGLIATTTWQNCQSRTSRGNRPGDCYAQKLSPKSCARNAVSPCFFSVTFSPALVALHKLSLLCRRAYVFDPGLRVSFPMSLFCFSCTCQFILFPLILRPV